LTGFHHYLARLEFLYIGLFAHAADKFAFKGREQAPYFFFFDHTK